MMCPASLQASLPESESRRSSVSSTWRPHEFQYLKCRVFHLGLYGCSIFFAYGLNGSSHTLGKCKVAVLTLSPNLMILSLPPLSILIVTKTGKLGSTLGPHSPFLPHLIRQQVLLSAPSSLSSNPPALTCQHCASGLMPLMSCVIFSFAVSTHSQSHCQPPSNLSNIPLFHHIDLKTCRCFPCI